MLLYQIWYYCLIKKKTKKLYCKFSCPALITVQTGFVWVLEYPGISLWHFGGLESPWELWQVLEVCENKVYSQSIEVISIVDSWFYFVGYIA